MTKEHQCVILNAFKQKLTKTREIGKTMPATSKNKFKRYNMKLSCVESVLKC